MKLSLIAIAASFLLAPSVWAGPIFQAELSPANEVPAIPAGDGAGQSNAFGFVTLEFADDLASFTYTVMLNNIETPLLQAHIHNAPPGQNGGIVANLFALCGFPMCGDGEIRVSGSNILISGEGSAPGSATFSDVVALLESGNAYVNVHTEEFAPGELRANFVPEPGATLLLGLTLAGLACIRRRDST